MAIVKKHVLVNGAKINKATVVSNNLLKKGSCIPGTTITPTSVTFHQTDCYDVDAPTMHKALNNANNDPYAGTSKSNYRKASWTITVGYNKIIQNVPLNWKAYAQGCTEGNNTSISIEMCMYNNKDRQYETYLNAIELFKVLKTEYKSSLKAKAHYDWTKKNCPSWLRASKFGYSWSWFKDKLTSTSTAITETKVNQTGVVNVDNSLNVRKGPGTSHSIIGSLKDKARVTIVAKCSNGWLKIKFESGHGYINGDYLDDVENIPTETKVNQTGMIKAKSSLNVRKGPGTSYAVMGSLKNDTKITIVAKCSNGWLKIKFESGYGYINGDYADNIKNIPTSTKWENGDYNCKVRTTENLNLRSGRGTDYKVVRTIPKGTVFTLGYVKDNWGGTFDYKNGDKGTFFSCSYIEKV